MLIAGTQEFMLFCLVLMRMSGFVFLNPILGRRNIPAMAKVGFALALTILIAPLETGDIPDITSPLVFGVLLFKEFFIGYVLGFVMELFSFIVTFAGAIVDFNMALGMASVYDAQNGVQVALTGNVLHIYFILLFFAVDGHLALMDILVTSADILPYAQIAFGSQVVQGILNIFFDCIIFAVKLVFPTVGIILILDIAVGILMKIVPQINVFILNIPLKILMGIGMLLFLISPIGDYLGSLVSEMLKAMQHALTLL